MRPRLVVASGPLAGQTFELSDQRFVIGRQAACDLQIEQIEVSRQHCEVLRDARGGFAVRDLGSRHGTQVNSRPVGEAPLAHSDLLTVGRSAFLFLLDDSSADARTQGPTQRRAQGQANLRALDESPRRAGAASWLASTASLTRKATETLHLDAARVDAALPAQARLARELHTLLQLSTALQKHRQLAPLAACLLDAIFEALPGVEQGAILLREPGLERPLPLAERCSPDAIESSLVARVLNDDISVCEIATGDGPREAFRMAAPLLGSEGETLGLIYLARAAPAWREQELEWITAIAAVASLAFQNVLHLRWLRRENRRLRDEDAARHDMIGESAAIRQVLDLVARVARADSTVLIQGESGTGKELVARAIHRTSPRRERPFIAVNCATLSDNLLESELFGHEKGAFTGATGQKIGKMEAAHHGTLFLDEVAEIPIGLQARLLRALEEREIERVGAVWPISIDIRLVAATHQNLEEAVVDGRFRDDLYYRLKVITCALPPLRDRREDIPLLARHLASRHGHKLGLTTIGIAPEARRCLLAYDWPGNVRELGNVIERAVVLGDGQVIRREDLPDEVATKGSLAPTSAEAAQTAVDGAGRLDGGDLQRAMVTFKKQLILDAWRAGGADYARAAEHLAIHVNSLHRMVKTLGLKPLLGR